MGSAHIDQAEADRLRDLLYKLAGTASMFGDDRLGELASHLEHALLAKPELSVDLLKECLPSLRKAS